MDEPAVDPSSRKHWTRNTAISSERLCHALEGVIGKRRGHANHVECSECGIWLKLTIRRLREGKFCDQVGLPQPTGSRSGFGAFAARRIHVLGAGDNALCATAGPRRYGIFSTKVAHGNWSPQLAKCLARPRLWEASRPYLRQDESALGPTPKLVCED